MIYIFYLSCWPRKTIMVWMNVKFLNVRFVETSVMSSQSIICCNNVMIISTLIGLFIIKVANFFSHITEIVVYSKVSGISVKYTAKYMAPFGTIEILQIPNQMKVPQKVLTQTQNLRNSMELEIDTQKVPQTPSRGNFRGFVSVEFPWKFHRFDLISWRMLDNSTRLHVT